MRRNKNDFLIQQLKQYKRLSNSEMIDLLNEVFYQLKSNSPWVLRYHYTFIKTGRGYEPSGEEVRRGIKEAIKLLGND